MTRPYKENEQPDGRYTLAMLAKCFWLGVIMTLNGGFWMYAVAQHSDGWGWNCLIAFVAFYLYQRERKSVVDIYKKENGNDSNL